MPAISSCTSIFLFIQEDAHDLAENHPLRGENVGVFSEIAINYTIDAGGVFDMPKCRK